jgi:hypothetical protein
MIIGWATTPPYRLDQPSSSIVAPVADAVPHVRLPIIVSRKAGLQNFISILIYRVSLYPLS